MKFTSKDLLDSFVNVIEKEDREELDDVDIVVDFDDLILARNLGMFGHRFLHLSPFQPTPIKPRSITHTSQAIKNFKKFTSCSEKV